MRTAFGSMVLAVLCAGCSAAPQPAAPPAASYISRSPTGAVTVNLGDQGPAAASDMAVLYQRICLAAFPDDGAIVAELQSLGAVELGSAQVAVMLHADPGRGWQLNTQGARYQVTLEALPYHTCAIRRMTRFGLPTAEPYIAALRDYAAQHGLVMGQAGVAHSRTAGGADVQLIGTPLSGPGDGVATETSMYVSTNYHGRFSPSVVPEAVGGVGVEIRMAHQMRPPAASWKDRT